MRFIKGGKMWGVLYIALFSLSCTIVLGDPTVTFQPGGTTNGTVFNDFGQLCAHIAAVGVPTDRWTIQIDGSFSGGSPSIATGTYALPKMAAFVGLANNPTYTYPTFSGNSVVFDPAPTELSFSNLPFMQFANFPAAAVITVIGPQALELTLDNCELFGSFAGSPFIAATNGALLDVRMKEFAQLGAGASDPVITVDATSAMSLALFDGSTLTAGAVSVASGGSLNVYAVDSAPVDPSYLAATGVAVQFLSLASQIKGLQSGTTSLAAGLSPLVHAVLTASSRIVVSSSGVGASSSLGAHVVISRVLGSPGSFRVQSKRFNNPSLTETHDFSSLDWIVLS